MKTDRRLLGKAVVDQAIDARFSRRAWIASHLHIAEAVEGEARRVALLAFAGERVIVGGGRVAQVLGVDAAVGIQAFGIAQPHHRAARPVYMQPHIAHHVLPHVEDRRMLAVCGIKRFGMQRDDGGDRYVGRGCNLHPIGSGTCCSVRPSRRGEFRIAPSRHLGTCIVRFTTVDLRGQHRRSRRLPCVIRSNRFVMAVVKCDVELCAQQLRARKETIAAPGQRRPMPSTAEHEPKRVFARGQHRCDIVGLVESALVEVRKAGSQQRLRSDAFAIQPRFVCAERCHREPRGTDTAAQREVLAQQGSVRHHAIRSGNRLHAIHPYTERRIERANLLRRRPGSAISRPCAPCVVAHDALFRPVLIGHVNRRGEGSRLCLHIIVPLRRNNTHQYLVIARRSSAEVKLRRDLLPVEGAPLRMPARLRSVDGRHERPARNNVQTGAHWTRIQVQHIAKLGGCAWRHMLRISIGKPQPAHL